MTFYIDCVSNVDEINMLLIYIIILLFFINCLQIYIYFNLQLCKNCCEKEYIDSRTVYAPRY
jgi:hypothetical protein